MIYAVIFTPAAQRDLRKLPKDIQHRIISKLEDLAKDPRGNGTL
jgi:mRNA-degrading endonuclease RelE of RelBE toxin-antitoxin system